MGDDEVILYGLYLLPQDPGSTKIGGSGHVLFKGKHDTGIHEGRLRRYLRASYMIPIPVA